MPSNPRVIARRESWPTVTLVAACVSLALVPAIGFAAKLYLRPFIEADPCAEVGSIPGEEWFRAGISGFAVLGALLALVVVISDRHARLAGIVLLFAAPVAWIVGSFLAIVWGCD
jgi:hypothetical protein